MLHQSSWPFVVRRLRRGAAAEPDPSPVDIFASGEPGVWLDPADSATLFSDTAGTTQAQIGDPVALVLDKSGNGNHAVQSTLASRPILREADGLRYLEFDGVDDALVTPTITPGTDQAQVVAGVRKLSDAARGVIVSHAGGVSRFISLDAPRANGAATVGAIGGGATTDFTATALGLAAPVTAVITGTYDISTAPRQAIRVNGDFISEDTRDVGASTFMEGELTIGERGNGSRFFNGRIYSLIVRFGPNLDTATIARTEGYVAQRTGVTL